jgi:hypothetical protein
MALSPTSSRGGDSGATAASLPNAAPTGATLDTTTYDNQIGSGKYTTLVFPDDNAVLAVAIEGDDFPRLVIGADLNNAGIAMGDGTADPVGGDVSIFLTGGGTMLGFNGYNPPAEVTTERAVYSGNAVNIANNGVAALTWDTLTGTALFGTSDPAAPSVVSAGIHSLTVTVGVSALTAAGQFSLALTNDADTAVVHATSPIASTLTPEVTIAVTRYFAIATHLSLQVTNKDGAAARDFHIVSASVQRITV